MKFLLVAVIAAISFVTGAIAASPAPPRAEAVSNIVWRECDLGPYQCGTMRVPLDHRRPSLQQIELAMVRLPAFDQENKIGSLLINPGGPGGSGIQFALNAYFVFGFDVLANFDIIGFDPRGVGQSQQIDCVDDFESVNRLDFTPDTPSELKALRDYAADFGADCQRRSHALIQHVNSEAVARDMDLIREALGEEQLTFFGFSYGTYLGAIYADLFPERVRALVLDGALDPSLTTRELLLGDVEATEFAFARFLDDCAARANCGFSAPDGDLAAEYDRLVAQLEVAPVVEEGFGLDDVGLLLLTRGGLYSPNNWIILGEALGQLQRGSLTGFRVIAEGLPTADDDDEPVDPDELTNLTEVYKAVACVDFQQLESFDELRSIVAAARDISHRWDEAYVYSAAIECTDWPPAPRRPFAPVRAAGAAPILVIGTVGDPATAYPWAVSLADQLESGVLVTYEGDGHTAYALGSRCIDQIVDDYLVDLAVPSDGTSCPNAFVSPAAFEPQPEPEPQQGGAEPTPTAVPRSGITAPDTGSGGYASGREGTRWIVAGIASMAAGIALLAIHRRTRAGA